MTISEPLIIEPNRHLDFGKGFYTTTNFEQALEFAKKVVRREKSGKPVVTVYEFDIETAKKQLCFLEFTEPNKDWLDYVAKNRAGEYTETVDITMGAVADDDVYVAIGLYTGGFSNLADTLKKLKIKELFNQIVFKSELSLKYLTYAGVAND